MASSTEGYISKTFRMNPNEGVISEVTNTSSCPAIATDREDVAKNSGVSFEYKKEDATDIFSVFCYTFGIQMIEDGSLDEKIVSDFLSRQFHFLTVNDDDVSPSSVPGEKTGVEQEINAFLNEKKRNLREKSLDIDQNVESAELSQDYDAQLEVMCKQELLTRDLLSLFFVKCLFETVGLDANIDVSLYKSKIDAHMVAIKLFSCSKYTIDDIKRNIEDFLQDAHALNYYWLKSIQCKPTVVLVYNGTTDTGALVNLGEMVKTIGDIEEVPFKFKFWSSSLLRVMFANNSKRVEAYLESHDSKILFDQEANQKETVYNAFNFWQFFLLCINFSFFSDVLQFVSQLNKHD